MSIQEIRNCLKHIASLCWSLSIELENSYEDGKRLVRIIKSLEERLRASESLLKLYRDRERNADRAREYYRHKKSVAKSEKTVHPLVCSPYSDLGVMEGDTTVRLGQKVESE